MRWLDGGQNPTLQGARETEAGKEARGIEVVFPGFIDHPELTMRSCISIGQDPIDLAPLQGHFIALVAEAEDELGLRSGHISQDNA